MWAFLTAILAIAAISTGAWFGLENADLSSADTHASDAVRLD